jgi:hypothetical protein
MSANTAKYPRVLFLANSGSTRTPQRCDSLVYRIHLLLSELPTRALKDQVHNISKAPVSVPDFLRLGGYLSGDRVMALVIRQWVGILYLETL